MGINHLINSNLFIAPYSQEERLNGLSIKTLKSNRLVLVT